MLLNRSQIITQFQRSIPVQRSIRLSLSLTGVAALALSSAPFLPAVAKEENPPDDLMAIEVNLKDVVRFDWSLRGATQGAGTPNQAGVGFFAPLFIQDNNVWFLDAQANANFADFDGYSSIINTDVAGVSLSTSTRLGYRWLNDDRSWMYGVNAGYDSRDMDTGNADTGVKVTNKQDVSFQQVAVSLEAVSNTWHFNAYALVPIGDTEKTLNNKYEGGALDTYGLDVGYQINPDVNASLGYYYQRGDLDEADGSGINGHLAYDLGNGLTFGANLSYDEAFDTRVSGNISYRFGSNNYATPSPKKEWKAPVIRALSEAVKHRDVRVHDGYSSASGCSPNGYSVQYIYCYTGGFPKTPYSACWGKGSACVRPNS